jgi:hypothetical protein
MVKGVITGSPGIQWIADYILSLEDIIVLQTGSGGLEVVDGWYAIGIYVIQYPVSALHGYQRVEQVDELPSLLGRQVCVSSGLALVKPISLVVICPGLPDDVPGLVAGGRHLEDFEERELLLKLFQDFYGFEVMAIRDGNYAVSGCWIIHFG